MDDAFAPGRQLGGFHSPKADMPAACRALEAWASFAQLAPGQPVFHGVDRHGNILPTRLGTKSVSLAVKRRMKRLEHRRGKSKKDAKAAVALCSGHSLRAGFATSAAAANVPVHRIQGHTRHASVDVLNGYIRENDQWTKSALRGWGF